MKTCKKSLSELQKLLEACPDNETFHSSLDKYEECERKAMLALAGFVTQWEFRVKGNSLMWNDDSGERQTQEVEPKTAKAMSMAVCELRALNLI